MIIHEKDEFHSGLLELGVDTAGIVTTADPSTGEVSQYTRTVSYKKIKTKEEKQAAAKARKEQIKSGSPYHQWANINFEPDSMYNSMLANDELRSSDIHVWHAFASQIRIDNWVCIQQSIICKKYHLSKATVSRSVSKLVKLGYLEKHVDGQCLHKIPKQMAYCGNWKHFTTPDDDGKLAGKRIKQTTKEAV